MVSAICYFFLSLHLVFNNILFWCIIVILTMMSKNGNRLLSRRRPVQPQVVRNQLRQRQLTKISLALQKKVSISNGFSLEYNFIVIVHT